MRTFKEANAKNCSELFRLRKVFSDAEEAEIVREYLAGESGTAIAARHGTYGVMVYNILKRYGHERRTHTLTYKLNEAAFDDAEQNEVASYFVGLLMADGCVYRPKQCQTGIYLSLQAGDSCMVEKFRDFLGTDRPVRRHKNHNWKEQASFCVHSDRLAAAIAKYGVVPRKSFTARPQGGMEGNAWFWRGCVDGDGCVRLARNREGRPVTNLRLYGSRDTCEAFSAFCKRIVDTEAAVRPVLSIFGFSLSGFNAYEVIKVLYSGCTIAMPRKLEMARRIIDHYKSL